MNSSSNNADQAAVSFTARAMLIGGEWVPAVSGEKREPASDIDTGVVDSLKALDPECPIREASNPIRTLELHRAVE